MMVELAPQRQAQTFRRCTCLADKRRPCRNNHLCHIDIDCMGIDTLSDVERYYALQNSDYPELMGAKLRQSIKRLKAKAKSTWKKMPKPLKVAAGIAAAPFVLPATAAAAGALPVVMPAAAPALLSKKVRKKVTGAAKKAYKKMPKALKVAAGIAAAPLLLPAAAGLIPAAAGLVPAAAGVLPGLAPKLAIAAAVKRGLAAKRKRATAAAVVRSKTRVPSAVTSRKSYAVARPKTAAPSSVAIAPVPVAPVAPDATTVAVAEEQKQKDSGTKSLLPILGGLALLAPLLFL